jgi:hypothetical protein
MENSLFKNGDIVTFEKTKLNIIPRTRGRLSLVTGDLGPTVQFYSADSIQGVYPYLSTLVKKKWLYFMGHGDLHYSIYLLDTLPKIKSSVIAPGFRMSLLDTSLLNNTNNILIDSSKYPENLKQQIYATKLSTLLTLNIIKKSSTTDIEFLHKNTIFPFYNDEGLNFAARQIIGTKCVNCGVVLIPNNKKMSIRLMETKELKKIRGAQAALLKTQDRNATVFPALYVCLHCSCTNIIYRYSTDYFGIDKNCYSRTTFYNSSTTLVL